MLTLYLWQFLPKLL